MADHGARRIKRMLDEGSKGLHKSTVRLVKALNQSPRRIDGVASAAAFEAIGDLRQSNRQLRKRISHIETSSRAKDDVLAALARFDKGFDAFADALRKGVTVKGKRKARKANRLLKGAEKDLRHARARLT